MRNPFEYGRELGPGELADRETEVAEVRDALLGGGKCFLVGPRRYGKSSVHNVGAVLAREAGGVVLRYNVEAFDSVDALLATLVGEAGKVVPGPLARAGEALGEFFRGLRPSVSWNPVDQSWSATLGVERTGSPVPRLVQALDGLEAAARKAKRRVGLVLDEVQHLVAEGEGAERQLRAAVQGHRAVGYVFAGSDTRLLTAMTADPSRPFYRLGTVRFLAEVPRPAFVGYLRRGFATLGAPPDDGALEAILAEAEEVPYNVQLLAHHCWNALRDARRRTGLTPALVREVHAESARRLDPVYSQLWLTLTVPQRRALQAVAHVGGEGLFSRDVMHRFGLPAATMQKSLEALVEKGICWRQPSGGGARLRLVDPLFGLWVRTTIERAGR